MKVYVETNPETIYSGRVKDEVKTTEIRMWFETDEEIEVLSLADYTKQVRKDVVKEIWNEFEQRLMNKTKDIPVMKVANMINSVLDQLQGENKSGN